MPHDIFISYSSKDKDAAEALCVALEQAHIRCWIAPRDVTPGLAFSGQIVRAIETCRIMLLVFSSHSNSSQDVLREVQLASQKKKSVVNFQIEKTVVCDDLNYYLSVPHRLDAMTSPMDRHYRQLIECVCSLLEIQPTQIEITINETSSYQHPAINSEHQPTNNSKKDQKNQSTVIYQSWPTRRTISYVLAGVATLIIGVIALFTNFQNSHKGMEAATDPAQHNETSDERSIPTRALPSKSNEDSSSGADYIAKKLRNIVIPIVNFEDNTVEEAVDFLRLRAMELDADESNTDEKGVNFVIRRSLSDSRNTGNLRIKELRINNAPLAVILKYICDQTKLRYKVDDFGVTLLPIDATDEDIFTASYRIPPDFQTILASVIIKDGGDNPFAEGRRVEVKELLVQCGIQFAEGTSAKLLSSSRTLIVCNTSKNLDRIEELIYASQP